MGVSVLLIKQGEADSLGEEMYDAYKAGEKMPVAVDVEDDDSVDIMQVKGLIVTMTSYERTERPTAEEVLEMLRAVRS